MSLLGLKRKDFDGSGMNILLCAIDHETQRKRISIESLTSPRLPYDSSLSRTENFLHQALLTVYNPSAPSSDYMPSTASDSDSNDVSSIHDYVGEVPSNLTSNVDLVELWYPKCAQKSYGSEKRFLCPPPRIGVQEMRVEALNLTIDPSEAPPASSPLATKTPQSGVVSHDGITYFRQLHINMKTLSKSFALRSTFSSEIDSYSVTRSLVTDQIQIVSKPSKKSLKQKLSLIVNETDCISLFNRINSQTVRTRYLHAKDSQLLAHSAAWSPLKIEVVKHAQQYLASSSGTPVQLHYGSTIRLSCGSMTSPEFLVVKVEKNVLYPDFNGPIGQMHKIALMDTSNGLFLSSFTELLSDKTADIMLDVKYLAPKIGEHAIGTVPDHSCWSIISVDRVTFKSSDL